MAALRSFFRYLYRCRDLSVDVGGGIRSVRTYRLCTLPKVLMPDQVDALLVSCDRQTVKGRRDHAILLLGARLGLRSSEVVNLTLDDIDWHRGVLTVRGKGGRCDQLPLPDEVAQAIAAYLLDGRRDVSAREVFLAVVAPYRSLTISALVRIFSLMLKRTGIKRPVRGSFHLLRHSLATEMLRNEASLEEIGQILRHNHPDSTLIYAKVDPAGLRPLAAVWPGGAQ